MKTKFKKGDKVVYTKEAHKLIGSVIDNKVHIIVNIHKLYDTINIEFKDGTGCDAEWIKKGDNKLLSKFASFFAGMLFFITFGFIDNVFVVFGSWITDLNITIDVAVNGGVWNTISDAAGILVAASVSTLFYKLFKIKENEVSTLQQFIGVIIGCLLPLVIYLII